MWVHPFRPPSAREVCGSISATSFLLLLSLPFPSSVPSPFPSLPSGIATKCLLLLLLHLQLESSTRRNAALSTMHICLPVSRPIVLSGPFFAFFCLGSFALFPSLLLLFPYPLFVTHSRFHKFQLLFFFQSLDCFSLCRHHSVSPI